MHKTSLIGAHHENPGCPCLRKIATVATVGSCNSKKIRSLVLSTLLVGCIHVYATNLLSMRFIRDGKGEETGKGGEEMREAHGITEYISLVLALISGCHVANLLKLVIGISSSSCFLLNKIPCQTNCKSDL